MSITIALAGNPNSGKTTLFNALTGSDQYVGNWPGVTVEKKEGHLRTDKSVTVTDLPGIYSLSPYSPEEVVARQYLTEDRPDVILNIIDGTNLERNLYLTTQLLELGIPVVAAINHLDLVEKRHILINTRLLSERLRCPVVEISALKKTGIDEAVAAARKAAQGGPVVPLHIFSGETEHALAHIEEACVHEVSEFRQRWYAVKLFERDEDVTHKLLLSEEVMRHIENDIAAVEKLMGDTSDAVIVNERYDFISRITKDCYTNVTAASASARIDSIVTNKWLGLPIFAAVMFVIYYIAMSTVGVAATDWANDCLFGGGWHITGGAAYRQAADDYGQALNAAQAFTGEEEPTAAQVLKALRDNDASSTAEYALEDEETLATETIAFGYEDLIHASRVLAKYKYEEPAPADYGVYVPGVPSLADKWLDGSPEWLRGLIIDGVIAGVGAVLGFVPQIFVLFFLLSFLEGCGYISRIAFVLDRLFRKFGLSGKSFIPILIGTGCGVPGIMAARTIENPQNRRLTVMTTTFIPCSAKTPFIAMIAGAIFGGSPWIAVSAYFMGIAAIIISGVILKKTRMFAGESTPFVMELPEYHLPTLLSMLRRMWERGISYIKKAFTIIFLSTIFVWFTTFFGWTADGFRMLAEDELNLSILARIGSAVCWIFAPLGWGNWQAAVASITGLVAKENIVGTLGILYGGSGDTYGTMAASFTAISGFSFLAFNLLCAPCFAAMGAIKREMNSPGWFWFAIGYQCGFAWLVGMVIYQLGMAFAGHMNVIGFAAAIAIVIYGLYMLVKKERKYATA
ncbi:MAG: ferrous iron transporter B [Abditibacteriota bacterium]|nr:ferrous iron transporter B [Abditibacteriota bacterium]